MTGLTNQETTEVHGNVEVRAFMFLRKIFNERNWPTPYFFKLERECNAVELAEMLDLPLERIEAVFINGKANPFSEETMIQPGDRIAFLPPGMPGPYRAMLGIKKL
ncbi:MoaD/ThiS family protein [Desulfitobacterium sp. AusDCA]|uniref:MoaD/ThiS family protein n=1 Tax=Desulfitobacterium sp. AusDCA TaxID=3240383 RepID=UPI003DA79DB8